MKKQLVKNQQGEIEFRKKLYQQQVKNQSFFSDEFDTKGIESILSERMTKTLDIMTNLKSRNFIQSPYIEIGAERCQRSLIMENDCNFNGAAVDISFDMLKSCEYYSKRFNKSKLPLRICCDVNNLPFLSNSISFAFCFETLHHFPEPFPVMKELSRVVRNGGTFLFEEEPFKQELHFNLYKSSKIYSLEYNRRSKLKKILDRFFAIANNNEIDHGIIENDKVSLNKWKKAISCFNEKDVTLSTAFNFKIDLFRPTSKFKYFLAFLLGGNISGICKKAGKADFSDKMIQDILICPNCCLHDKEILLHNDTSNLTCRICNRNYPIVEGVLFLLAYDKFEILYPEIFTSIK